jgi:hypothetical protein
MSAAAPLPEPIFGGGLPSLTDYCNEKWAALEEQGAPPVARYRAEQMAAGIPLSLLGAVGLRCMLDESRRRLRAEGKKAIPAGDQAEYRHPEQMALPDIQAFILANYDRRMADAKSELEFVQRWCDSHPSHDANDVYSGVGLKPPEPS